MGGCAASKEATKEATQFDSIEAVSSSPVAPSANVTAELIAAPAAAAAAKGDDADIAERAMSMPPPRPAVAQSADEPAKLNLEDFEVGRLLGRGAFGRVRLATLKRSGERFAMKSLDKRMLVQAKQVGGALTEKEVLKQRGHPFIVRLYYSFQDANSLHMILDYCPGGDLYDRIEAEGCVSVERARLYAAEITLGLGHLHDALHVIYRDIKPENILIDVAGHALLTDFGLALSDPQKRKQFCGSTEYIAPEVVRLRSVRDGEHDKAVDWWGLGAVLHELLVGRTPFCHDNHEEVRMRAGEQRREEPRRSGTVRSRLPRALRCRCSSGSSRRRLPCRT